MSITTPIIGFGQDPSAAPASKAGVQAPASKGNAIVFLGALVAIGLVVTALVRRET